MSKQIARSKKYFHVTIEMKRGKGAFGMDKEEIFARRLDNSKKKREVVTKRSCICPQREADRIRADRIAGSRP